MKLPRYASNKDNPAVKGNLTAEEIVRADWARNYEKKGISLITAKQSIKAHVDSGGDVFRLRNTIILVTPKDGYTEVEFHTITADPAEVYQTMMLLFLLGLNKAQGTELAYTYADDRTAYRMAKKLVGNNIDIDESDDPDAGKYVLSFDLAGLARESQARLAAQGSA